MFRNWNFKFTGLKERRDLQRNKPCAKNPTI